MTVKAGMRGPLAGIRVLDLSRVLAGPWCTMTLADLGAEVWKLESLDGDDTRRWLPLAADGTSTYFMCANRGKQSVAVDLGTDAGRGIALELAVRADVVVENFRLASRRRLGLGYEELAAVNPRLVYCSLSAFGREGSAQDRPGYDFLLQGECGLMAITGEPEGQPMRFGVAIVDLVSGMNAVQAILAALFARERSGAGGLVEIALYDSGVQLLANVATAALNAGRPPERYGNAHAAIVPYQLFPTSDGVLALAVGNDEQFRRMCETVGSPELAADERFRSNAGRVAHRDVLVPELAAAFRRRTTGEWTAALAAAGVPAGTVETAPSALAAPLTRERGLVEEVEGPGPGTVRLVRSPLSAALRPHELRPPPLLGEHTRTVLAEVLGYGAGRIAELERAGVVRSA